MIMLNFHPRFICELDDGTKRRTVRKNTNLKPGDVFSLGTTVCSGEEKICDVTCTRVRPVRIDYMGVSLEGRKLYPGCCPGEDKHEADWFDSDFAKADGFDCFDDMTDFFEKQYGLPFDGHLIEWTL